MNAVLSEWREVLYFGESRKWTKAIPFETRYKAVTYHLAIERALNVAYINISKHSQLRQQKNPEYFVWDIP